MSLFPAKDQSLQSHPHPRLLQPHRLDPVDLYLVPVDQDQVDPELHLPTTTSGSTKGATALAQDLVEFLLERPGDQHHRLPAMEAWQHQDGSY